jgi:two-component system, NarL family, response regulator LiaR
MNHTQNIRILIVDDHTIVRQGLLMVLEQEPDFDVVGAVENGRRVIESVYELHPDVVLLDLIMPEMDGVATAMALRSTAPKVRVLVLTGVELNKGFPKPLTRVLAAGIENFIPKDASPVELGQAIRMVAAGAAYLHPSVEQHVLHQHAALPLECYLTPREQEVLHWMATSATYREIADTLMLGEETVRSHAKNILTKLHQPNRFQAVLEAIRYGFIDVSSPYTERAHTNGNGNGNGHERVPRCTAADQGLPRCAAANYNGQDCPIRNDKVKVPG